MDLGGNAGMYIKSVLLGAGAWMALAAIPACATTPDQLYQTWQKNSRDQPEIAEKAAQDYLHAAPAGPHARTLQIWLDAYRKTLASLLSRIPQSARQGAANSKQASAQPSPSNQVPAAHSPAAPSPLTRSPPNPPTSSPPPSRQVAAPPPPNPPPSSPPPSQRVAATPPPVPPQSRQPAAPPPRAPETRMASAPNPPPPKAPQPVAPEPAVPAGTRQSVAPENNASKKQPIRASRDSLAEALPEAQSLPEALAFIADKVGGENEFDFVARFRDPGGGREIVEHLSYKASNVTIDPNRCRVSYRWHVEQDYRGMPDQDRTVELRLAKSITVQTISQALTELNNAAGHPFSVSAQPQAYAVHIARWDSPTGDNLYFRDSRTAARVGEVARRAMALCDDKDGQAFRGR